MASSERLLCNKDVWLWEEESLVGTAKLLPLLQQNGEAPKGKLSLSFLSFYSFYVAQMGDIYISQSYGL